MVKRLGLLLWLFVGACGTAEPRTQLLLVADTDIPLLDTIEFAVQGPDDDKPQKRRGPAQGEEPVSLALEHTKGKLGPFTVSAHGFIADSPEPAISRTHEVYFVRGKTLIVPLHLVAACVDATACDGLVCSERDECLPRTLAKTHLLPYNADLPRVSDAGAGTELTWCENAGWIDTQTDPDHCGACEVACPEPPDAAVNIADPMCEQGACSLSCETLWGDCNGNPNDGCEQPLTTDSHCGACESICRGGRTCSPDGVCVR